MSLRNGVRNTLIALVFILFSAGYLITMMPAGPTYQVEATVVSRASRSGPTGNTGVLICALKSAGRVSIEAPTIATVQSGDKLMLNAYDRYFIEPKYSFAGKLIASKDD